MIDKIVAPAFAAEGFYATSPDEPGTWLYARQAGDVEHKIYFRSRASSCPQGLEYNLEQRFYTSVPNSSSCHLFQLIEGLPLESELMWYQTEEQFEKRLIEVVKLSIEKAIPLFDCLARPIRSTTRELDVELSTKTQKKAETFMKTHGMTWASDASSIMNRVLETEEIIRKVQLEPFEEVKDLLLCATAYLGELIRQVFGGEWMWEPNYGRAYLLCKVGGYESAYFQTGSLNITTRYWQIPEIYGDSLRYYYGQLLEKLGYRNK